MIRLDSKLPLTFAPHMVREDISRHGILIDTDNGAINANVRSQAHACHPEPQGLTRTSFTTRVDKQLFEPSEKGTLLECFGSRVFHNTQCTHPRSASTISSSFGGSGSRPAIYFGEAQRRDTCPGHDVNLSRRVRGSSLIASKIVSRVGHNSSAKVAPDKEAAFQYLVQMHRKLKDQGEQRDSPEDQSERTMERTMRRKSGDKENVMEKGDNWRSMWSSVSMFVHVCCSPS